MVARPISAAVGDVNGDGKLDLMLSASVEYQDPEGGGGVSAWANVLFGRGDGRRPRRSRASGGPSRTSAPRPCAAAPAPSACRVVCSSARCTTPHRIAQDVARDIIPSLNSWAVRWFSLNGNRFSRSFKTRKEAERFAETKQAEVRLGNGDPPNGCTIREFWKEHRKLMKGTVRDSTLHMQLTTVAMLANQLGWDRDLRRITSKDILPLEAAGGRHRGGDGKQGGQAAPAAVPTCHQPPLSHDQSVHRGGIEQSRPEARAVLLT
jgi:hypothetical protein